MSPCKLLAATGAAAALSCCLMVDPAFATSPETGAGVGAPVIDGQLDGSYGAPAWVQNLPTTFGDNGVAIFNDFGDAIKIAIDNSNIAGVDGDGGGVTFTPPAGVGDVTTGVEYAIPLDVLDGPDDVAIDTTIRLFAQINASGNDYVSNQGLPGFGLVANLANPAVIDHASFTGDQFASITVPGSIPTDGPTIDGTIDEVGEGYTSLALQTTNTGFGNATDGTPGYCNGSELDELLYRFGQYDPDGAGPLPAKDCLFVAITGNMESNYNKLELFIDSIAGAGQNTVRSDNAGNDFNALNKLAGMTFDVGFDPDIYIEFRGGDSGGNYATFADAIFMPTLGGGTGNSLGSGGAQTNPICAEITAPTNLPPDEDVAFGSELDAFYWQRDGDRLYLFLAGNLESNANALNIFFDCRAGGQNTLLAGNSTVDFDGLGRMAAGDVNVDDSTDPDCPNWDGVSNVGTEDGICSQTPVTAPGLTFDADFAADYFLSAKTFGDTIEQLVYAAPLRTDPALEGLGFCTEPLDYGMIAGGVKSTNNPATSDGTRCVRSVDDSTDPDCPNWDGVSNVGTEDGICPSICEATTEVQGDCLLGDPLDFDLFTSFSPRLPSEDALNPLSFAQADLIQMSINNLNVAGVTGVDGTGGDSVTTGIEFSIRLDELGWDGVSPIKIAAFITSGDRGFISNQILGGMPTGFGSLAEPRTLDLGTIGTAGDFELQYIEMNLAINDCNANSIDDSVDILGYYENTGVVTPASNDADMNGIPDECVVVADGACSLCTAGLAPDCFIANEADCLNAGGSFLGSGTDCSGAPSFCPCDWNCDANLNDQDFFDWVNDFFSGSGPVGGSDYNNDGFQNDQDWFDFTNCFFTPALAGC